MRFLLIGILLTTSLAGCLDSNNVFASNPDEADCTKVWTDRAVYLDNGGLSWSLPGSQGSTPGNAFAYAFVTNNADEWLSEPFFGGMRIVGDVTLDVWIERSGAPSLVLGLDEPQETEAWQLFSQFGSTQGFSGTYHNVYTPAVVSPGTVHHLTQTFTLPEGGLILESGDQLRLLLTNMAPDSPLGPNHNVLWGGETPSALTFQATCYVDRDWATVDSSLTDIAISANGGLLTGAVPDEEGVTHQSVPFTLDATTERLTIALEEGADVAGTPKDDMDLLVTDSDGNPVWSIGSPYADERGRLWAQNLDAFMPYGEYIVEVRSYSGVDYEGLLTITQETSPE